MKKLVETIVKPLVDYPEDVKVTQELCNGEIKYRLTALLMACRLDAFQPGHPGGPQGRGHQQLPCPQHDG